MPKPGARKLTYGATVGTGITGAAIQILLWLLTDPQFRWAVTIPEYVVAAATTLLTGVGVFIVGKLTLTREEYDEKVIDDAYETINTPKDTE